MSKKINLDDLIGKKYNKLTILRAWRNSKGKRIVEAQCECGTVKEYMFDSLQNGNTKSCGCAHQKIDLDKLIGKKYGKLTILKARRNPKNSDIIVECQCECGKIKEFRYASLQNGNTQTCGCSITGFKNTHKHCNGKSTRLYKIYNHMRNRCYNKNDSRYKNITDKNIQICQEWLDDFENFYNWAMNNDYNDNLNLNRIDLNKDYCPENCRWVTTKEQANNKPTNHYATINNETKSLNEWCIFYNINYDLVFSRITALHWDPLKALTTPAQVQNRNSNNDELRLNQIWQGMQQRCYNPNSQAYKYYGSRGIIICDEWKNDFDNFYNWAINNGYKNDLTIDRINVNDNYCPENCRWATYKEQNNNTRQNQYITINDETKTLKEWCDQYNIRYRSVYARINSHNWDPIKALTTPIKSHEKKITIEDSVNSSVNDSINSSVNDSINSSVNSPIKNTVNNSVSNNIEKDKTEERKKERNK